MQYMGAFYTQSVAGKLIEKGVCSVDSKEVLTNVDRLRRAEEAENRSITADGLLSMQATPKSSKKREYVGWKKSGPLNVNHECINVTVLWVKFLQRCHARHDNNSGPLLFRICKFHGVSATSQTQCTKATWQENCAQPDWCVFCCFGCGSWWHPGREWPGSRAEYIWRIRWLSTPAT